MTKAHISFCKSPYFVWAEAKRRFGKITRRFRRIKRRFILLKRRSVLLDLQIFTNMIIFSLFVLLVLNRATQENNSIIFEKNLSLNNNFVSLWHQMWIWIATLRYIQTLQTRVWTWFAHTRLRTMPLSMQWVAKSSRANATPTAWLFGPLFATKRRLLHKTSNRQRLCRKETIGGITW